MCRNVRTLITALTLLAVLCGGFVLVGCDALGLTGPAGPAGADGGTGPAGPAGPTGPAGSVDTATIWRTEDSGTTQQLRPPHFADGRWITTGGAGTILTSGNGSNWTAVVDTKNTASTADDTNWTTEGIFEVFYGNGTWVAGAGGSTVLTSTDGDTWASAIISNSVATDALYYGNGTWVAGANSGRIYTSEDAATWTEQTSGVSSNIHDVYYSSVPAPNGLWVAVGRDGTIITSGDSETWTARTSNATNILTGVGHDGDSRWVVVGYNGTILTSTDGETWTAVVDDKGTPADTSDDTNWTTNHLDNVAYGNNTWVAVGNAGTILTSTDGQTWEAQRSGTSANLLGIHYDLVWVATGDNGTILTAP